MLTGISTSFISTISTLTPHGSVASSTTVCSDSLILSRSLSTSSSTCWPMMLRKLVSATWYDAV